MCVYSGIYKRQLTAFSTMKISVQSTDCGHANTFWPQFLWVCPCSRFLLSWQEFLCRNQLQPTNSFKAPAPCEPQVVLQNQQALNLRNQTSQAKIANYSGQGPTPILYPLVSLEPLALPSPQPTDLYPYDNVIDPCLFRLSQVKFPDLWPVNKILLIDVLGSPTWGHACWLEPLPQTSIPGSHFSPAPNKQEVATEERERD